MTSPVTAGGTAVDGTGADAAGAPRERYERFALFAECMLAGILFFAAALPLVTAPAAFAAACTHIRRHRDGERAGLREFAADVRAASGRRGLLAGAAGWAVLAALLLDVHTGLARDLPAGPLFALAGGVCALALVVTAVRAAASWAPGAHWRPLARAAARRALAEDPSGSALLVGGLLVVAVVAWQLPPLVPPALGCLAAASVAVERRLAGRRLAERRLAERRLAARRLAARREGDGGASGT